MYYYVMEDDGLIQYVMSPTPPAIPYRMLTREEYEAACGALLEDE